VVLVLGVLQHLLGLAGAAERVQRALRRGHRAAGDVRHGGGHRLGTRELPADLGGAAELLDATLELLRVILRLAQVLLEALLVRRASGQTDVRLKRLLELLLLAVCLVQVLDDLCVPGGRLISHRYRVSLVRSRRDPHVLTRITRFPHSPARAP
jgi:hypothetical protein